LAQILSEVSKISLGIERQTEKKYFKKKSKGGKESFVNSSNWWLQRCI